MKELFPNAWLENQDQKAYREQSLADNTLDTDYNKRYLAHILFLCEIYTFSNVII